MRTKKGVVVTVPFVVMMVVGALGIPIAADVVFGERIMPDSALYGLEIAGERIQLALGMKAENEIADERIAEADNLMSRDMDAMALQVMERAKVELPSHAGRFQERMTGIP